VFRVAVLLVVSGCANEPPIEAPPPPPREEPPPEPIAEPASEEVAAPPVDLVAEIFALDGSRSTSIGAPHAGRVEGAVALPDLGPGFLSNPRRPNETGRYGTVEMVQALMRAAAVVEREMPGSAVKINDLGFEAGGPIPHHGSHQAGRDVDVLFYLLDAEGRPREGKGVPIEPDGTGHDYADLAIAADDLPVRIDVPRTWRFLQALVEDERALVQRVFVVEHVRAMLLAHARAIGAPAAAVQRVDDATCQPGAPHDDHLHIRFFCTAEDIGAGCEDTFPMYGWRRDALAAEGVRPLMAGARAREPEERRRTTTPRPEPPVMHADVVEFLARRERWAHKPHPGRRYCR
jgi:penicillin-insensitive murein DD-endopeptidase